MSNRLNKFVAWSLVCFFGFVVAIFFTQFGDPATESAKTIQDQSGYAILIIAPLVWIAGCLRIFRSGAH